MGVIARLAVLAALCGLPFAAGAQTIDNKLRGVDSLALVFQDLDQASRDCGVTKKLLTRQIDAATKKLPVDFTGSRVSFDVRVVTMRARATCFSSVDLSVYGFQPVRLRGATRDVYAKVVLWEASAILATVSAEHGAAVGDRVRELAGKFAADWMGDNR